MDAKGIVIIILSLLVIIAAVFGILSFKEMQQLKQETYGQHNDRPKVKSATIAEKEDAIQDSKGKSPFKDYHKAENSHIYQEARHYNNRSFRKAWLVYQTGRYDDALRLFTDIKVDTLDPELGSAAYYYIAQSLVNLGKEKKALFFLNRVVRNLRSNYWTTKAIILQGQINRKYQFSNESLEVYLHKLYIETPENAQREEILTQLGYLKLFRNKLDDAMTHFQRADTQLARLGQARVHVRQNRYWKAISIYEDMLKHRNFKNIEYYRDVKRAFLKQTYHYAKRWFAKGDYDHAYFYMRKIVNFFPDTMYGEASLYWIGEIFFRRRIYSTAIRYFNLVLSNGNRNKNAAAQYKKALAYYYMRRYGTAIRNFRSVVSAYPRSGYASRARQWIRMSEREIMYRKR